MNFISLILSISLVFLGNYLAWHLVLRAFPKLNKRAYLYLSLFVLLSFSFVGSYALNNFSNLITFQKLYLILALLFGILIQLMIFGFLFFLYELLLKYWPSLNRYLKLPLPFIIARIFLVLALLVFLLATCNAFSPRVKTISLDSSAYPRALTKSKFVHISDLHLGAIYRPAYLSKLAQKINKLDPDFIIISGDLFDGSDQDLSEFIPAFQEFEAKTIFVPGNHDYYIDFGHIEELLAKAGIDLLSDEAMQYSNWQIVGYNYLEKKDLLKIEQREIKNFDPESEFPILAVNHVPSLYKEISELGTSLVLSGHTHRGQIFPLSIVLKPFYGPYFYGLAQYQDMLSFTSQGVGSWGPPLRSSGMSEILQFIIK